MTKTQFPKSRVVMVALTLAVSTALTVGDAAACSLVKFSDNGRYVGGDLPTQIAAKADTIQIVRVKTKRLVSRTYAEGDWYLNYGDTDVPSGTPEFLDEFVFELEPVETLKGGNAWPDYAYDNDLRVRGFGPEALQGFGGEAALDGAIPNALPSWLPDRPGNDGYAFIGAAEHAGLGGGECSSPYILEVGETLLALRNSNGTLYPASGGFPLEINVEFLTGQRKRDRWSLNMQSLVPINGSDDAFVARLRQDLASRPNSTRN